MISRRLLKYPQLCKKSLLNIFLEGQIKEILNFRENNVELASNLSEFIFAERAPANPADKQPRRSRSSSLMLTSDKVRSTYLLAGGYKYLNFQFSQGCTVISIRQKITRAFAV